LEDLRISRFTPVENSFLIADFENTMLLPWVACRTVSFPVINLLETRIPVGDRAINITISKADNQNNLSIYHITINYKTIHILK
jgi:hypothetical protein